MPVQPQSAAHDTIIRDFTDYIVTFVEEARPEFGNLPICPFARRARLEGRMRIEVSALGAQVIAARVDCFDDEPRLDLLILVHPVRDTPSCPEVYGIAQELNRSLPARNLLALAGHPADPFNIDGLHTRREPYPNIQILRVDVAERAYKSLEKSAYYERWSEENFRDLIPVASD
jgi:hypothetical protein